MGVGRPLAWQRVLRWATWWDVVVPNGTEEVEEEAGGGGCGWPVPLPLLALRFDEEEALVEARRAALAGSER